jgi:hypothetical protein
MIKYVKEFNCDECKPGGQRDKNAVGTWNYETTVVLA